MAISLRMVALDTPSAAPRATVLEPTGCPVSMYSSISALRMAALRSSMALPRSLPIRGCGTALRRGRRANLPGMLRALSGKRGGAEEAGGGLVGEEPPGRG